MKFIKTLLLLFLITNLAFSQSNIDTIHYDSDWKETSKESSSYYRHLTKISKNQYQFQDFWKAGELQSEGGCSSIDPIINEGEFKWFYKNGNLKKKMVYKNNEIIGFVELYDNTGKFEIKFLYGFENLDNANAFNSKRRAYMKHVKKNIQYPKSAAKNGIQGRVYVSFYIDKQGKVNKAEVVRGVDEILDNEAVRVVSSFDSWPIPIYKGKEINISITIPVNFSLN